MRTLIFLLSIVVPTFCRDAAGVCPDPELVVALSQDEPPYVISNKRMKIVGGLEASILESALPKTPFHFKQLVNSEDSTATAVQDGIANIALEVDEQAPGAFYSKNFVGFVNAAFSKGRNKLKIQSISDLGNRPVITWTGADQDLGPEFETLYGPGGDRQSNYHEFDKQFGQVKAFWSWRGDEQPIIIIDETIFRDINFELGKMDKIVHQYNIFTPAVTVFRAAFADENLMLDFNKGLAWLCSCGQYERLLFSAGIIDISGIHNAICKQF